MLFSTLLLFSSCWVVYALAHLAKDSRINQGEEVSLKEYPFMVNIWERENFICGGTLLTTKCILTSRFCVDKLNVEDVIVYGYIKSETQQAFKAGVSQVLKPSSYDIPSRDTTEPPDVALLVLERRFNLDEVTTIALDTAELDKGDEVIVAGWGGIHSSPNGPTDSLRIINSTVSDDFHCKLFWHELVNEDVYCIEEEAGKRPCAHDTGGPAVHKNKQVGIVSRVNCCDHRSNVGLYTRISSRKVQKFIKTNIANYC